MLSPTDSQPVGQKLSLLQSWQPHQRIWLYLVCKIVTGRGLSITKQNLVTRKAKKLIATNMFQWMLLFSAPPSILATQLHEKPHEIQQLLNKGMGQHAQQGGHEHIFQQVHLALQEDSLSRQSHFPAKTEAQFTSLCQHTTRYLQKLAMSRQNSP